ncbi:MAG: helix-turn-helix domain-containing protein [Pseudomonadota bacterium]
MATKKKPEPKKAPAKKQAAKNAVPKKPVVKALPVEKVVAEAVEDKPGRGRPSAYRPEFAEQAYKLALLGCTDRQMADIFRVTEQTLNNWKTTIPEFFESLRNGKEIADADVAKSLYHRAKGYEHPEDDIRVVSLGNNMGSEIVITPTIKRYPPDTGAAALWLSNRQPGRWRTKVEVEHGITDNVADILMAGRKRIAKPIEQ